MRNLKQNLLVAGLLTFSLFSCSKDNVLNQSELKVDQANVQLNSSRKCASHEYNEKMLLENAAFKQKHDEIEAFTRNFVSRFGKNATQRNSYTIPVVVHIVHKEQRPEQRLGSLQIQSQIDVLNEDFRKLNANFSTNTPSVFQSVAADCEINFVLDRVIYKQTNKEIFSADDKKENVKLESPAIDPSKYLNIWVCDLKQGVLGYAQFPGGPAETDGVVIHYLAFGRVGTLYTAFNKGRTATHEVGHYLNLYHIWGDDSGLCEYDDTTPGFHRGTDEVADTPDQGGANYGCPTFPDISCNNGPNGDMFMNYMDYSDDACMSMFTNGQKARMLASYLSRFGQ